MSRAWSFFWLVVASCMAIVILMELLRPYLWAIVTVVMVALGVVVSMKVYRSLVSRRRHF